MCRFCTQHGDGKLWYLRAENYIADLDADLERRGYMIEFAQGFKTMRPKALLGAKVLDVLPNQLADPIRSRVTARQEEHHFGQPVPIEECERIFDIATSIVRLPCICRTHAGKPDNAVCLAVTTHPNDSALSEVVAGFDAGPDVAPLQRLTKEQALELLRECERDGLMHSVWTFKSPLIGAICNCDMESGCLAMRMNVGHNIKTMWRGEYVAVLDKEKCTGCGACVKRCPFFAFDPPASKGAPAVLRAVDCWGCGVCRSACRADALSLTPRSSVPELSQLW